MTTADQKPPRVLVVGATGRFARLVVPALRARGAMVRALVRDAAQQALARQLGAAEAVPGDLRDPRSLERAAEGCDGVFHIGPAFSPDEASMGVHMVAAARHAGVRRFVFSSVTQVTHLTLANHASKVPVESALFESGLQFTILRPANFFQNLQAAWPAIVRDGVYAEPNPVGTRVARVDYRDVAEAAAIALTSDRLAYGCFELSAPGWHSRSEIAALAAQALGRPVRAEEIGFDAWAARIGLPDGAALRPLLARVHAHYAAHGLGGNDLSLHAVLGRTPRTLSQYIEELAS